MTLPSKSAPELQDDQLPGLRILIVEDNKDCAVSTAMLLRQYGHDVTIAQSGPEAIEDVDHDEPDVVLLDIGLPGMSGYDVAKELTKNGRTKAPILVAISGFGQPSYRQQAADVGIGLYLLKPVDPKYLEACLRGFQMEINSTAAGESTEGG